MKISTQITVLFSAMVIAAGVVRAEPLVEPRFDQSFITADFEGQWAGLPVEKEETIVESKPAETVVFKEEVIELPIDNTPVYPDPLFVSYPLYPTGRTVVFGVAEAAGTDVVLLDNGYDQGFRVGMLCEVLSGNTVAGEVILIEVRNDRAAALITQLSDGNIIRFGDAVRIKTVQYL